MKGTYRIPLGTEAPLDNVRVKRLLKSFDSGAQYTLTIHEGQAPAFNPDCTRFVEVSAWGGKARRKALTRISPALPPVLTPEQCSKRRADAVRNAQSTKAVLPANLRRQWIKESYSGDWERNAMRAKAERRAKCRAVGQVVARLMARHGGKWFGVDAEDYADLDAMLGKVKRISKLTARECDAGYLAYIVREYGGGCLDRSKHTAEDSAPFEFFPVLDYQLAKLDVEFWQELETLSGRRERWAPGIDQQSPRNEDEGIAVLERVAA